ncbi:MAG: hypothetical protein IKU55_05710, partial [Clostridia bacterium]|nr:hypothetical protein [Clostridia bacterium]
MKRRICLLICVFLWLLGQNCYAYDGKAETDTLYAYLPQDTAERVRKAETAVGYDLTEGLGVLANGAWEALDGVLKNGIETAASMLAICLVCSAVSLWLSERSAVGMIAINCAAVSAVFAIGMASLNGTLTQVTTLLTELNLFSKALVPTLTAAGIAAGESGTALARQSAALWAADVLIMLFRHGFVPAIYVFLALRGVGIMAQNAALARIAGFIKNTLALVIRVLLTVYFGYLSVSGLVGKAADTLAKRAAKTAISAGIPLVGGVLTDAAEAIYAGGALARSAVGVFGLIAVLSCALLPLLSAGCAYLCLRVSAALAQNLQETGGREGIDAVADAVSMVFALCAGATGLLLVTV